MTNPLDPVASRSPHSEVIMMWRGRDLTGIPNDHSFRSAPPSQKRVDYILCMLFKKFFIPTKSQSIWISCFSAGRTRPSTGWHLCAMSSYANKQKNFPQKPFQKPQQCFKSDLLVMVLCEMCIFLCAHRPIACSQPFTPSSLYSLWKRKSRPFSGFWLLPPEAVLKYVFPLLLLS